ncbi:MAG TPA: efflux RND transporter periplasmic adaptor subunit [Thermoanaerobaculia bacterium]|nr:efflux RND transporter periplasmic adaptor subunit [Thermoanaerobaculia bacterium]
MPEDGPEGTIPEGLEAEQSISALAELALCENLAQTSGWAAHWSAEAAQADGALLWAPDTVHPLFLCIGAYGEGTERFLRRSAPRDAGLTWELVRDRQPIALDHSELAEADDPLVQGLPRDVVTAVALPLEAEGLVVALLVLLFTKRADPEQTLTRLSGFLEDATPALGRALRAERKTIGMLRAIERLTNLYDLSKAFGSTIEWKELTDLVVRKAADFATAETASLWLLEGDEIALAASAVNDNYEIEHAPDAVGATIVGDVLADQTAIRRNRIPEGDPSFAETDGYPIRSLLGVPLVEDDVSIGCLVVANKRGRHPEFSPEDEELLQDLGRQAVRALRTSRQHEAEKKVQELDALLAVSREITSTLDLDKVMQTIVNATAALITYDRCGIGILEKGRMRLGAISGAIEVDRAKPEVKRLEELLQWVFFSGSNVSVTQGEDGKIVADRPETEEKFRAVFHETGLRSFYGVLLADEEGKLGALAFECKEPIVFDEETQDLLQILVNQATVAVRNAQLYQQVPLAGFWKPLIERRRKLLAIPRSRRRAWVIGLAATLVLLFVVPWRLRIAGPARILPGLRASVTAGVDGVVGAVLKHEGDRVGAGDVIATLKDEAYEASVAEARAGLAIAESEIARNRETADAGAMFQAQSRRDELRARIALAEEELSRTRLKAPVSGIIVTPRIEERVGQFFRRGEELCVVADVSTVTAEVAVPEAEVSLVKAGQEVSLKMNPYPTRTFPGKVAHLGARIREDGEERFLIAEVRAENPDGLLKTGMLGMGKVWAGRRSIATLLLRKPVRYLWRRIWPLLP